MNPLIIAHRGASGEAPENTIKSFRLAATQNADGIELDIYLTRDKQMIIHHDDYVKIGPHRHHMRHSTYAQLLEADVGEGEKIPLLKSVFEELGKNFKIINVEIKSTGLKTDGIEKHLVSLIDEFDLKSKVLVSSFNPLHLIRLKKLDPKIRTGYLMYHRHWIAQRPAWSARTQAETLNLEAAWFKKPSIYKRYTKLNKKIWVWTVNSEEDMRYWIDKKVDAIITNYPARLKSLLTS